MGEHLHSMVRKRIGKEMKDNNEYNYSNWILFNADKNKEPFLFIPINLYPSLQKTALEAGREPALVITFQNRWPWAPPKVTYYEKEIQELYRTSSIFERDILKLSDIGCLCCGSILCKNRWSITSKVQDIINEFIKITSWRARVVERFLCKKLQYQKIKLPVEDYPIFEYL